MKKIGKNTKLYLIGMIIGGITLGITTVIADTIINSTSVAYKTTTVKAALDELYDIADFKQEVKDMLYPVGSIYISVSSTNPSELFGGTWESFGMGRTLLGVGWPSENTSNSFGTLNNNNYYFAEPEVTGGQYKHVLTVDEMPSHSHEIRLKQGNSWVPYEAYVHGTEITGGTASITGPKNIPGFFKSYDGQYGIVAYNAGSGSPHNNMQPYVTVYMWKRIA